MAQTQASQATNAPQIKGRNDKFSLSNSGSYSINNLSYPSGISSSPDLLHYVCFFVNLRGKSSIFAGKPPVNAQVGQTGSNQLNTQNMGRVAVAGGAALGVTSLLGLGKTFGTNKFNSQLASGATAKSANTSANIAQYGTQAVGGLAVAAATAFAVRPDTTYRIADVITLHLPHAHKVQYNAQYVDIDLGTMAGMLAGGSSAKDASDKALSIEYSKSLILAGAAMGAGRASKLSGGVTSTSDQVAASIQLAEGQVINPFREVIFKSVAFRKHIFNYTFMPKSKAECDNIFNIIKTFRYHSMPELSKGSLYMIAPSEFSIQIYYDGVENLAFPKIATSVLENIDIVYGDEARFTSFNDGFPTEIKMQLIFRETSLITKDSVSQGY
jgi:hypothetical protein